MFSKEYFQEVKTSLNLAFPIVIAQLGVVLMSVSDNIMIGRFLGKEALAAAGLSNSVAFLIAAIAVGGFPVISPLLSKHFAAKNSSKMVETFTSSISIAIIYSVFLTAISIALLMNFDILGQTDNINRLSKPFFFIIIISNIPLFLFLALKQTFDGLSLPKVSMIITFLGLSLNLLLNYALINGFGFIPKIGLNGAAYSTLIVRVIMFIALLLALIFLNKVRHVIPPKLNLLKSKEQTLRLLKLSIPSGLQFLFEIGAFSVAVIMMGWISEDALAAHQIAINISATTYMTATGIAFSGAIRVGHAVGLESMPKLRLASNVSYTLVSIFMTVTMLLILIFNEQLISLYIQDSDIISLAKPLLAIAAVFQLSDGIQAVALGNLRGISDVKIPAYITFIAYWIISLPLGYLLAFHTKLGAAGIWYALLIGLSFAAIFLCLRFYKALKNERLIFES
ncbi:MATE family efflux transporter [Arcticibacterium luteifluviistationis]|uniref:Multidrug-efflux transporter n=1 Tax=Arcticibacterium luteifluviistationis TaxID=1784714 RepID=A0A2Z4GE49_9BACT|nr:MATE family efflux transporter [Arcticibacterium luteifluviistationis]AWV99440.1 MATE family efflux transporter [Arcticibacterium luteifluviistationis]